MKQIQLLYFISILLSGCSPLTSYQISLPAQIEGNTASTSSEVTPSVTQSATPTSSSTPRFDFVATTKIPNDPLYSQLSGLTRIDSPGAWAKNTDCSKVLVGVLDSGIDYRHPDLQAAIRVNSAESASKSSNATDDDGNGYKDDYQGWNFVNDNNQVLDDHYHGTHTSGIIAAAGNNGTGTTGVCWQSSIVPLKVLDSNNVGTVSDLIDAIQYGINSKVKIFNASLINFPNSDLLRSKISLANDSGILFIVASGNSGTNNDVTPNYPSSFGLPNIISVAAVDPSTDQIAYFSNYGSTSVQIAAPGVQILSTTPITQSAKMATDSITANYARISGTSMAAPFVTGVAALLWSSNPSLTLSQVKNRILDRSDTINTLSGKVQNSRRLNAKQVLTY